MAYDAERDHGLVLLPAANLFDVNTSSLAVRRGRFLKAYVYRFIELCSPELTETVVRRSELDH
jgi:LysR family cys regulon transcriptional activator